MMPEYQSLKNVEIPKYFHSLVAFFGVGFTTFIYKREFFLLILKKWDVNLKNFP